MPLQLSVTLPPGATVLGVAVRVGPGGGSGFVSSTRPEVASTLVVESFANSRNSYVPGVFGTTIVQEPDARAVTPAVDEQLLV
jgi:hypothetical protein